MNHLWHGFKRGGSAKCWIVRRFLKHKGRISSHCHAEQSTWPTLSSDQQQRQEDKSFSLWPGWVDLSKGCNKNENSRSAVQKRFNPGKMCQYLSSYRCNLVAFKNRPVIRHIITLTWFDWRFNCSINLLLCILIMNVQQSGSSDCHCYEGKN